MMMWTIYFMYFGFLCHPFVRPESVSPLLLLASHADIRLIPVENPNNTQIVVNKLKQAVACDYIYDDKIVFWMDAKDFGKGKIQSKNLHDPDRKSTDVIATGMEQPDGLACDWVGRKLYWTDAETNRIEVSELDGSSRKVLIWGHLDEPRAIAVDPAHAYLYWTDWGEEPKIERAGMDGTKRQVLVNQHIHWPNGITIDYNKGKVYWVEANYHFIHRMNLDGSNREEVISSDKILEGYISSNNPIPLSSIPSSTNQLISSRSQESKNSEAKLKLSGALQHPSAISLQEEWIYWTDWATESIYAMLKNGSGLPVVKAHGISPMDLQVYSEERQKPGRNPCGQHNGNCSHLCLLSPDPPYYRCACSTGVQMLPDGRTCKKGPNEILLLAQRADLRVVSLDTDDYSDVLIPVTSSHLRHAVAIEFDPVEEFVYWTDDDENAIFRVHLNGTGAETIVQDSVEQSDGMAIDWIARNLYWTDTGRDCITVSRMNGTSRKVLIETEIEEPRAIVLDPVAGHLYWSDWGSHAKIERTNLDGSVRLIFVDTDVKWPNGLALDLNNSLLFWADARDDRIEMIFLNGTERTLLLAEEIPHIFGLSILGNFLYWTDWQRRRLERMEVGDQSSRRVLIDRLPDIYGVKATSMTVRPGTNPCAVNNGGCSHLCLYTPEGEKCYCPSGLELAPSMRRCIVPEAFLLFSFTKVEGIRRISLDTACGDAHIPFERRVDASFLDFFQQDSQIYWTNAKEMTISRSFMNGSKMENFVDVGIEMLEGLAVDWVGRNVYWADSSANRIEVAHMDRPSRRAIIWSDIESPRCLALDPANGYIYWSEWGSEPRLRRANMDGSNVMQINKEKTGRANSLSIDYKQQRLYWVDFDINCIVSSDMQGNDVIDLVNGGATKTISSLTLFGDYIYWSDSKRQSIERVNKVTGHNEHVIESGLDDIDDILVYDSSRQSGVTSCSSDNGGCQHFCFSLPGGSHTCACPDHYYLNPDNLTCAEPLNFLLISQTRYISRIIFKLPGSNLGLIPGRSGPWQKSRNVPVQPDAVLPMRAIEDACSIDYDPIGRRVYWLDCKLGELRSAKPNGTEVHVLLKNNGSGHHPFDLSIDPYGRFLYWTDSVSKSINVMKLDGTPIGNVLYGTVRVPGRRRVEIMPRRIVVDSVRGRMYFTNACHDVSPSMCRFKIMKAALDGSDCLMLFKRNLHNVSALVIDSDLQRLYWADQKKIEWSTLDGGDRTLFVDSDLSDLVGLAVFGEELFWANAEADGGFIEAANKIDGSNRRKIQSRIRNLRSLISVISMNLSALRNHPCSTDNGGCTHICVTKDNGSTRCSCPSHLTLVDNFRCGEPTTCGDDEFTCMRKHQCIPLAFRCDKFAECSDETDEIDCPNSIDCKGKFSCGPVSASSPHAEFLGILGVQCVEYRHICDGKPDCIDGRDEQDCPPCNPGEIHCQNNKCVSASSACEDCQEICPQIVDSSQEPVVIVVGIACGCALLLGIALFLRHCMTQYDTSHYPQGVVMFTPNSDCQVNLNVKFQPCNDANPAHSTAVSRKRPPFVNLSIVPPTSVNGSASCPPSSRGGWPAYPDGQLAERPIIPGASSSSSSKLIPPRMYQSANDSCSGDYFCSSDSPSTQTSSYYRCKNGHKHRRRVKPPPGHGPPPPTPCTTDTCEDFESRSCRHSNIEGIPAEPPPPYHRHHSCCYQCYHQHNGDRRTSSAGSGSSRRSGKPPSYDRHRSGRRRHYLQFSGMNSDSDPYAPPPTPRSQYMSECCDTTEVEDAPEVEEITNALSKEDDEETVLLAPSNRTSPCVTERSYSTPLYNPPPSPVTDSS